MAKKQLSEEALNVLKECRVEGNNVYLPDRELDRNIYLDVKKHIELIGGKWKGGKTAAFVFEENPTELLALQANGEGVDLKQQFQFFGTPPALAKRMASYAKDLRPGMKVLEPSAGKGALIEAIHQHCSKDIIVDCFELMELNRIKLQKLQNVNILGSDFMAVPTSGLYDFIIANPPFTKNQDIDHILKMYDSLKVNGRLITLASISWTFGSQKKQIEFREWLEKVQAYKEEIPEGEFKESGTNVRTMFLVIYKNA